VWPLIHHDCSRHRLAAQGFELLDRGIQIVHPQGQVMPPTSQFRMASFFASAGASY
jgi:hypothetical protein